MLVADDTDIGVDDGVFVAEVVVDVKEALSATGSSCGVVVAWNATTGREDDIPHCRRRDDAGT